jgi:hypothetical protein
MPSLMEELGQSLRSYKGIVVQYQAADMIVELPVSGGRRHTVKVQTLRLPGSNGHVLRLQSRAALISQPRIIRKALSENGGTAAVGFALDATVDPPSLDVVCGLIAEGVTVGELLDALQKVSEAASAIDARVAAGHHF